MSNATQGYCPQCGQSNVRTHLFCASCGQRLPWADSTGTVGPAQQASQSPSPSPPDQIDPSPQASHTSSYQTSAQQIPVRQLREEETAWNPAAIAWISFFFTFIPAGVMSALNYERLGHPERKWKCLLGVIVAGVIYTWVMAQLVLLPSRAVSGFSLLNLLVSLTYHSRQKEMFERHLLVGGRKAPIGGPVALSFLWMLLFIGGLGVWASMSETRTQAQADTIALASDALADKATQSLTQFDNLEQEISGKDYIRDRAAIKQMGQKQTELLRQTAAQMRAAADKLGEVNGLENASPEFKKHASLFAQARRKRAEALEALRERAQALVDFTSQPASNPNNRHKRLLIPPSYTAPHVRRALLEQRANQLVREASALEKQAERIITENQPSAPQP